jgi:predicted short-subunit dehydrogenase-like oxidoreductase (DUF2520 family)
MNGVGQRIVILGSGRVAEALCRALPEAGQEVVQLFARNSARGKALAALAECPWESRPDKLAEADLYLMAVSDRAIPELSASLDFRRGVVAHTCGSGAPEELSARIERRGVFYPLQTFSEGRPVDFREVPIFLEAEHEADYALLERVAASLSGSVHRSDARLRQNIHVAAVFVCNFVNDLYAAGEVWMRINNLDFNLLKPLIAETTRKMLVAPSPLAVQTGPAVREDGPTIEKHLQLLEKHEDLKKIYEVLTAHIIQMKKSDGKF